MSLWGTYDLKPQSNTATASIVVSAANTTAIGTNTKFADDFSNGNYLYIGNNNYVITTISNNTVMTVRSANSAASPISGASSNSSYIVSEKPMSITFAQASNAQVSLNATAVYGVSAAEMNYANNSESYAVSHAGWNLRTVGTGGRAGRVHYETLVAGGIAGDADDDTILPE